MLLNPGNVVITKLSPIENALGEKFCPAAIHTYEECKKTVVCRISKKILINQVVYTGMLKFQPLV